MYERAVGAVIPKQPLCIEKVRGYLIDAKQIAVLDFSAYHVRLSVGAVISKSLIAVLDFSAHLLSLSAPCWVMIALMLTPCLVSFSHAGRVVCLLMLSTRSLKKSLPRPSDRPAFSRFLSSPKCQATWLWYSNHDVRPLAGRTVRLSSMLAMQAEVSHTFHAVALNLVV